jgi:hypothetical protein
MLPKQYLALRLNQYIRCDLRACYPVPPDSSSLLRTIDEVLTSCLCSVTLTKSWSSYCDFAFTQFTLRDFFPQRCRWMFCCHPAVADSSSEYFANVYASDETPPLIGEALNDSNTKWTVASCHTYVEHLPMPRPVGRPAWLLQHPIPSDGQYCNMPCPVGQFSMCSITFFRVKTCCLTIGWTAS